jgi:murein DD-endopeptidase MepM/ murein hydrolase activator NlpD
MSKSKFFLFCPLGVLILFACGPDGASEHSPTGPNLRLGGQSQCADECVITTDSRPFLAARSSPDSLSGTLVLADVVVNGSAGAAMSLQLFASQQMASALPRDTRILVTAGAVTKAFTVSELTSTRATIYRFAAAGRLQIRYALSRGAPSSIPLGDLRLTQYAKSAVIVSSERRWITRSLLPSAQMSSASGCAIAAPVSRICGITVSVNPYAPAATYEGTFQSNPGTGASAAIGITFSQSVPSVTMTIYDPTYSGNTAQAYDSTGALLGSVDFVGTGIPGVDVPDTKTLTFNGIRSVILTPAQDDYVSYDASFAGTPGPGICGHAAFNGTYPVTDVYEAPDTSFRTIPHMGRDYALPIGTQVFSIEAGRVVHAAFGTSSGGGVVISGSDANSYYFHLSQVLVSEGATVQAGTLIGLSGNTGHVRPPAPGGAHLHFEQHVPGGPIWDSTNRVPKGTQFEPCKMPGE